MTLHRCYDLIRTPVITEKTTFLSEQNKFTFYVSWVADKYSVRRAIEKIFEVKVKSVNILNIKGKTRRFKNVAGRTSDRKKAIVTLQKGCTIDFAGGVK